MWKEVSITVWPVPLLELMVYSPIASQVHAISAELTMLKESNAKLKQAVQALEKKEPLAVYVTNGTVASKITKDGVQEESAAGTA